MSARIGWRACPRSQRERESWALYAASLILLVFYKVSDQKLRGRAYTGTLGGKREWQHLFSRKPKRPRKQHRGRLHSITRSLLFSLSFQKTLPASSQLPFFPFSRFRKRYDEEKRSFILFFWRGACCPLRRTGGLYISFPLSVHRDDLTSPI